ncbi:hypothetical protein EWB00_008718 [Schistosoma japonicum]|uniref:Uncharacterized protein n=1 Tax=Schistosoma japonicum TaxID=6182 RepID=A0A4Z2CP32_SCHJA|nr:hypothetical protein EWB00_008718 [Schistosoma japonicum]
MVRASPSEQYDKLGLLSNSYSFLWETNSFNSAFNKTNIDTTNVAYNFKLYEKAKYKSFLLIFYKTTKHKIEKTFNNLQRHQHYHHDDHRVIHNTNYAYNKGEDTMSIPNNVQQATDKKQCRISNEMSIKYTQFHNASNDNTLQSLNSSSSSLGRIVHRKHVKYRKWKDKIKSKYKTCAQVNANNKTISCYKNIYSLDDSCQSIHFNYVNYVHKQFLFSQTINDGQWETFLFLINIGININTIQRMSKLCSEENQRKQETNTINIYPSVIDLFLNNIPLYTSTSKCSLLNSQYNTDTIRIYSRILSCLLDNGANVYNLDNDDTFTLNGGIQCKTVSKICQQIAMQLESSLHTRSNNVHNHHVIDNAGILRQLLTNGMMPTKLFLLDYTHPLALDMHKSDYVDYQRI